MRKLRLPLRWPNFITEKFYIHGVRILLELFLESFSFFLEASGYHQRMHPLSLRSLTPSLVRDIL